ncbi:MAG: tetratricopeptide repeat protein [Acidobacteriota bacterium]
MITALASAFLATLLAAPPAKPEPPPTNDIRQQIFARQSAGVRALRAGEWRVAVVDLCWAMDHALNSHDAAWYCGQARLATRDPEGAIEALEIATDLDPTNLSSWIDLGDAYAAAGRTDRARAAYYRALEIRKDHAPAFDGLARLNAATGDEDKALEFFGKALEANAADARVLLHRGQFHLQRGRLDQALEDVRAAARLRPDDAAVQAGLARVLVLAGMSDDALAAARRARQLKPKDAASIAIEAEIFRTLGAFPEAIDGARSALAIDPDLVPARLTLGRALGATGELDAALAALIAPQPKLLYEQERNELQSEQQRIAKRKAELAQLQDEARRESASPAVLLDVALAQLNSGDLLHAAELARAALASGELDPVLLRQAALILGRAGHLRDAEPLFERLANGATSTPRDWVNLGVTRERSGDREGARAAFRRALELPAVAADGHAGLARLAWAEGDTATTAAELDAFLAASPPSDQAVRAREALMRLRPAAESAK